MRLEFLMFVFDIIVLVLIAIVLLGLAWLSEKVKDWLWSYVFRFLGFLLQTALGLGIIFTGVVLVGIYVFTDWIPHFTMPEDQTPYWFRLMLWGMVAVAAFSLAFSGIRRLFREEGQEQLAPEPVREPISWSQDNGENEPFPWGKVLKFEAAFALPLTGLFLLGVYLYWGTGFGAWDYTLLGFVSFCANLVLGFFLWIPFDAWLTERRERLEQEAYEREQEAVMAERRLRMQEEADRAAEAEREAEAARSANPPFDPWSDRTDAFNRPLMTPPEPSDPFGSRLIGSPPVSGPRDPAGGGPTLIPAPGTRRMPPPTFGRPPARPAEERDMERSAPVPPRRPVGRREPVEDTGGWSREQPRGQPKLRWPYVVGALLVLALAGVAYWFWPEAQPSEQDVLVERAAKMKAEETLRTYMKVDPVMSKNCPQGWNDDCWRTLHDAEIELPPCVQVGQSQVNTTGVSWRTTMDDRCIAEMIGQNEERIKEAAAQPSGEVEKFLFGTEFSQRHAFEARDTARINALLDDPALKREVILDFWMDNNIPWRILAHPSLNQGDLTKIYGVVQANGWYEAMLWLTINPNLDPNLRGMWLTRPVADPVERERQILLGMHQPAVSVRVFSWLVTQALDEYKEKGSLELWNILLKAGENGDLRVDKCHLEGEKDKDRKTFPLCEEGRIWDTVGQMERAQAKDSTLPSPSIGWTELRYRCAFESYVGRHSGVAQAPEGKVIRTLEDASPPNLPPEP